MTITVKSAGTFLIVVASVAVAQSQPAQTAPPQRIAFYGTLAGGLAEAQRSGRPILLVSGAPHCHGVSGLW